MLTTIFFSFLFYNNQQLFYYKMPKRLDESLVIVMEPMLATGESLKMAIQVLLDHNVPEDHILVATLIAAPQGLHSLSYTYPKVILSLLSLSLYHYFIILSFYHYCRLLFRFCFAFFFAFS